MNMMERTMRSYCMVRFVSLLLIGTFIAGCTQANNSEVTTSQMSALSTPKDQLPLIPDDIIRESGIDTVYADADGNGVADRIERCGSAAICIYLKDTAGQESSPRTYKNADWARVSIERVEDVNDIPGNEVIVKTVKPDGGFGCICIITAKDNSLVSYTDPAWFSVTIDSIADTDGVPGTEIILSVTNPKGDFHCICVVHPNSESHVAIAAYSNAKWKYVFVRWQDDTDGSPGQELILEVERWTKQLGLRLRSS